MLKTFSFAFEVTTTASSAATVFFWCSTVANYSLVEIFFKPVTPTYSTAQCCSCLQSQNAHNKISAY